MDRKTVRKRFRAAPRSGDRSTVKLSDVAARAGVSAATASRALNAPDKVSEAMRERVRAAAAVLGYVPDAAARALASRRSRTIGAVVPTLINPIFATGVQGLESRLEERGYALVVASSDYRTEKELRQAITLMERGVEGLMFVGTAHRPALHPLLRSRGIPFVTTWSLDAPGGDPCIGFDNVEAAVRLTDYLLDLGHRRFAVIAGVTRDNDRAEARVAGVRKALDSRGVRLGARQLLEVPYEVAEGREALRAVIGGDPATRPTAVICGNDILAFGVLFEAGAMGLAVPHDISVVGFDDNVLSGHIPPGLTTMHVPTVEMGRLAADYLVDRIEGRPVEDRIRVEVRLTVRGSSGPPPRAFGMK